ncbi:MAG: response regulator [Euryarchaeota archaeon]|nr:response regulator [Euryarchaeota archaeon]
MLVDDDTVGVMTVKQALDINVTNPLIVASDGEDALSYLGDEGNNRPGIILLDFNMPRMNGIEFLTAAKKNGVLKNIPVVVLTTSREGPDKVGSFNLSVSGYMVKPVDYARFVEVMKTINLYWTLSELPEG